MKQTKHYSENATIVDQLFFGIDKDGNVTYATGFAVGHPHLYQVEWYTNPEDLQYFFEKGYKIFLYKNYKSRGCAINFENRENFIKKYGFKNLAEVDAAVIEEVNKEFKNRKIAKRISYFD